MMLEFIEQIWEHVSRWITNTNIKNIYMAKITATILTKKLRHCSIN